MLYALIFAVVFFLAMAAICLAFLRSASKQRGVRANPRDLRRSDDAERAEPFDQKKAIRAVWDVYDQTSGPQM